MVCCWVWTRSEVLVGDEGRGGETTTPVEFELPGEAVPPREGVGEGTSMGAGGWCGGGTRIVGGGGGGGRGGGGVGVGRGASRGRGTGVAGGEKVVDEAGEAGVASCCLALSVFCS